MASKKPRGRPVREFSESDRKEIEKLAGYGLTHDQIAIFKGCSRDTLTKHCSIELERGKVKAIAEVTGYLFGNIKAGDQASIFFYLKTQAGWREKQPEQGEDKEPPPPATVNLIFLPKPDK